MTRAEERPFKQDLWKHDKFALPFMVKPAFLDEVARLYMSEGIAAAFQDEGFVIRNDKLKAIWMRAPSPLEESSTGRPRV